MHDLYIDKTFQCDGNVLTAFNNFLNFKFVSLGWFYGV
jgi:hypothetical protein